MDAPRRPLRHALVRLLIAGVAVAGVAAAPSPLQESADAARLKPKAVRGGIVVQLVGAKSRKVVFFVNGRRVARLKGSPSRVLVRGARTLRSGRSVGYRVVARDRAGRRLAQLSLAKAGSKRLAPSVTIGERPASPTTATDARFTFTALRAQRTECKLDAARFSACKSPTTYARLGRGAHIFTVRAVGSASTASASARWTISSTSGSDGSPQPPPPPPPPSGSGDVHAPVAPGAYTVPTGAMQVSTSAGLASALAGSARDIVLAAGVYDGSQPFYNVNGHRIYAAQPGQSIFKVGLVFGGNWGPGAGLVQGVSFDVSDPTKILEGSIIHVWGTGKGSRVLDTTLEGHGVVPAGIVVRQVEGFVAQRVVARNFLEYGILIDNDTPEYVVQSPPLAEDLDVSGVSRVVPRSSNGTSEACIWIGNTAVLRRARTRDCAWEGVWTGSALRNALFEHLDIDRSGIGIYMEHFTYASTFQHMRIGPNVRTGVNCEWADPAWGSKPGCVDNVIQDSYFDTTVAGVYLDEGTTRTTVRRSTFVNQSWAGIGNYHGVGNLSDTSGNDYRLLRPGALPVRTEHIYSA